MNHTSGKGEYVEAYLFGVASIKGRPLLFHVHTVDGAKVMRLPITALCWKPNGSEYEVADLQLWDCLSGSVECIKYEYFRNYECSVKLGNNKVVNGMYLFTLDNLPEGGFEETPDQHKDFNFIMLDDGNFCAMPNNRILWKDKHFTKINGVPDYKTITDLYMVESNLNFSSDDNFFYEDKTVETD